MTQALKSEPLVKAITIRIDAVIFDQISAMAKKEKRSFNNYTECVLTAHVDSKQ